jgi:RNA polymerase sigma-70 factor (ECF subfamily)
VSTPDDLLERQEQENLLQAAIDALPPTYRRIITMFYFDSCSHKEIAAHLDVSVAAVKSMLHRARQRLKKEMSKNG